MRCCSASAVRILTLISLLVLASHSFVPVCAQDSAPPNSVTTPTDSPTTADAASTTSHTPSSHAPTLVPSKTPTSPSPSSTPPTSPSPANGGSSDAPAGSKNTSSETPSDTPSSFFPSSTLSSDLTSSTSTSTPTSTFASTTPGTTLISGNNGPTYNVANTDDSATYKYPTGTIGIVHPTDDGSQETSSVQGAASQNTTFFDNKGAVAGTFFAAGLVVIGLIGAVVFFLKRRRRRFRDAEDEVYFEKYHETPVHDHSPTIGGIPGLGDSSHDLATPARADAYPDRAIHHGWGPQIESDYNNPQEYGVEYPPGTAYAAAQSHSGQYQYSGQTGASYTNGRQGHHVPSRTSPGPHPFADPTNVSRRGAAPPVGNSRSVESHYSNQSAYSGTAY